MEHRCYILKTFLFNVLCFISVCSCNRSTNGIDISSIDYYVLEYHNYKETPLDHDVFPFEYKPYKLSTDDIVKCERLLKKQIEEVFNINSRIKINLESYSRQYIGAETPDGRKIAFINLFCDPERFQNKDKYLVVVYDGGVCYFNLKIDLSGNKIIDFVTNGLS